VKNGNSQHFEPEAQFLHNAACKDLLVALVLLANESFRDKRFLHSTVSCYTDVNTAQRKALGMNEKRARLPAGYRLPLAGR